MSYTNQQPKDFMMSLQIIHFILLMSIIVFAAYVSIHLNGILNFSYANDRTFLFIAITISFIGNLLSKSLFLKLIKKIPKDANLLEKTKKYSIAHIFRLMMLVLPALMCIIFVMESHNSFYFILVGILLLIMLTILPSKIKFVNDVPLNEKEKSILQKL
jgi:hypothetical protein